MHSPVLLEPPKKLEWNGKRDIQFTHTNFCVKRIFTIHLVLDLLIDVLFANALERRESSVVFVITINVNFKSDKQAIGFDLAD